MSEEKDIWMIRVAGYGTFEFEGTEQEAEEMRRHKGQWERGFAIKWRKDCPELVDKLTELKAWFFDRGGCPSWVFTKIRSAKKEA